MPPLRQGCDRESHLYSDLQDADIRRQPGATRESGGCHEPAPRCACDRAVCLLTFPSGSALAQSYPNRPVRIIVPFAAGGAVDTLARLLGNKLTEQFGQPVVVENRAGAGGNLAPDSLAKAAPTATPPPHQHRPGDQPRALPHAAVRRAQGFRAGDAGGGLAARIAAHPKLPANSFAELIALAKAKPGGLNYGSTGIGNPLHLTMEMLKTAAGIDIQAVPYRGDAPLNAALIAGEIQVAVVPMATTLPHLQNGLLKALAVGGAQRAAALPNVPTVAETLPGFESSSWQGRSCRRTPRARS